MNNKNPNPEARWLGVFVILAVVLATMILPCTSKSGPAPRKPRRRPAAR